MSKFQIRATPPFLKSKVYVYIIGTFLFALAFSGVVYLLARQRVGGRMYAGVLTGTILAYMTLSLLFVWWFVRSFIELKRRVKQKEVPCWHCGYDLTASEEIGVCPECGKEFELGELREKWGKMFELPTEGRGL